MVRIENEKFIIELAHYASGETLNQFQKALIMGIQEIADSEHAAAEDHKEASYFLSELLKGIMLNDDQANVALGGKPYASDFKKAT